MSHLWRVHIPNAAIVVEDSQGLDTVTVVDLLILYIIQNSGFRMGITTPCVVIQVHVHTPLDAAP